MPRTHDPVTPIAPPAPAADHSPTSRDRVDIRPTAALLRGHVSRFGTDATCRRFALCRRRLDAIVSLRTTRGQPAHFLDRSRVEDLLTHSEESFGVMHVPLAGPLHAHLTRLLDTWGPDGLATRLRIDLPRRELFVLQIAAGRAGNGAPVTHVCASIAERAGVPRADLDPLPVDRAWCVTCAAPVLVAPDRRCPWCDTPDAALAASGDGGEPPAGPAPHTPTQTPAPSPILTPAQFT